MDEDSSDISAAQLAAIQKKGQFNRSISLALSAKKSEDSKPPQDDGTRTPDISATTKCPGLEACIKSTVNFEHKAQTDATTLGEDLEDVQSSDDVTTEESTSTSSDDDYGAVQITLIPQATSSRRRRRTKLQRHRMRQSQREFLAPLLDEDDLDDDISCLGTVEAEDRPQRVPTLMELCMQKGFSRSGPFPPGLRPALSQHHNKARLAALQMRWLGRNLALLEKQIKWNLVETTGPHGLKCMQLRRNVRSLWRSEWWPNDRKPHPQRVRWIVPVGCQAYDGANWKIAALAHYINLTLPHLSSDSDGSSQKEQQQHFMDRDVQQVKRCLRKRYPKLVKYCFDHAMAYVWWARGRCNRAQDAFIKTAKQYPTDKISETERSTLWARHRSMVLVEIGRLLVTFNLPDSAGQFYREAADMADKYLHPEEVAKLSLQSLALTASAYDQGVMDRQSAVQASSLWMVAAKQAVALKPVPPTSMQDFEWGERGEHLQEQPVHEAVLAAVESLLHCHAGHLTDSQGFRDSWHRNRVWLTGARAYLEKLQSQQTPFVGLYLSFVLAMLNEGIAAENAYHYSLLSTAWTGHPGEISRMLTEDDIRPHPWWLFRGWITARTAAMGKVITEPLRVLPLVWRRGLQQPSYRFDRSPIGVVCKQVADIQGLTPDLHVTPKGHLTGAMVQNLPPMTKVCFDAYNGQVHLGDSCCEDLHRWDNYGEADRIREQSHFDCNSSLPQPNVIYNDPLTSTTVSVMITSMSKYYELEANRHPITVDFKRYSQQTAENLKLIQRESQPAISVVYRRRGTKVTVNIVDAVLQEQKKQILEAFSSQLEKNPKCDAQAARMKEAEGFIDFCINRSCDCTLDLLQSFMETRINGSSSQPAPQHTPSTNRDFAKFVYGKKNLHRFKTVEMRLKSVLYVGKATVVLLLQMRRYDVLLFLDCSSAASFSRPILRKSQEKRTTYLYGAGKPSWVVPSKCHCWNAPNPTAGLLFTFTDSRDERDDSLTHFKMHVFDESGDVISFKTFEKRKEQDVSKARYFTSCEGPKIIGTNKIRTKVTVCDYETQEEKWSAEFARIEKVAVAQSTVYISTIEGVYALAINSLEPLVIVHLNSSDFVAPSNDNGLLLYLPIASAKSLKVLGTNEVIAKSDGTEQYRGTFLGMENHVLLVRRRKMEEGEETPNVLEVKDVMVPGKPVELCYLSETAGFVVSATIFSDETQAYYRENLYWFDMAGNIIATHPFIGRGRHEFLPVYLRGPKDDGKADNKDKDLYLYFADGLGALCCIKLDIHEYR
ncbi:uncharacterized protein LOC119735008 [Patiria miniata]|uniref:Uncharacterized protein n=1 Tax=Patiria miniata TaxID=46514 RepID=A0A914ALJ2_PATMI|nr:uncharacterized protein LOC119735008 [Patiria miniata]XP_038064625.1 uncharacterized protein LOC119735008 [Patiria miniata]